MINSSPPKLDFRWFWGPLDFSWCGFLREFGGNCRWVWGMLGFFLNFWVVWLFLRCGFFLLFLFWGDGCSDFVGCASLSLNAMFNWMVNYLIFVVHFDFNRGEYCLCFGMDRWVGEILGAETNSMGLGTANTCDFASSPDRSSPKRKGSGPWMW